MPRLNIDSTAFTDPRFEILASKLAINRHEALGRCLLVWHVCLERERYVLPGPIIDAAAGIDGFAAAMSESHLACARRGGFYVTGTRGRIEWLSAKRATARKNGRLGGRPRKPKDNQHRIQTETPPALAPAPALSDQSREQQASSGNSEGPPTTHAAPPPTNGKTRTRAKTRAGNPYADFPRDVRTDEAAVATARLQCLAIKQRLVEAGASRKTLEAASGLIPLGVWLDSGEPVVGARESARRALKPHLQDQRIHLVGKPPSADRRDSR